VSDTKSGIDPRALFPASGGADSPAGISEKQQVSCRTERVAWPRLHSLTPLPSPLPTPRSAPRAQTQRKRPFADVALSEGPAREPPAKAAKADGDVEAIGDRVGSSACYANKCMTLVDMLLREVIALCLLLSCVHRVLRVPSVCQSLT
jgi:hypothetical protein